MLWLNEKLLVIAVVFVTLGPSPLFAFFSSNNGDEFLLEGSFPQPPYFDDDAISELLLNPSNGTDQLSSIPPLKVGAYDPVTCRNSLIPFIYNYSATPPQRQPFRDWPLKVKMGEIFYMAFTLNSTANCPFAYISLSSFNDRALDIFFTDIKAPFTRIQWGLFVNFTVVGKVISYSAIKITIRDPQTPANKTIYSDCEGKLKATCRYIAVCYILPTLGDQVYDIINIIFIVCCQINIGLRITWTHVKSIFKKPLPCIVGLACHFVLMPLTAFALGRVIDVGTPELALGYFFVGIIAGGGLSNLHSQVLGGDFPLSAVMTYVSQILALPLTPMWLAIFAPLIIPPGLEIKIPYDQIVINSIYMLIPAIASFAFRYFLPKHGFFLQRFIALPFIGVVFLYFCTYGLYQKSFMFLLFTPAVVLCGCLLPYFGFILSGLISMALRFPLPLVITIMMETSFQNAMIAMFIIRNSITDPIMVVLTGVGPYSVVIFSQVPIVAIELALIFKRRCWPRIRQRLGKDIAHEELLEDQDETDRSAGASGAESLSESTRAMQEGSVGFDAESETDLTASEETRSFFERKANYFGKELIR